MFTHSVIRYCFNFIILAGVLLLTWRDSAYADDEFITDFAGADVNIGERLFLETRFSEYFFTNSHGDANAVLPGDPTVAKLRTGIGSIPGPFAGQAMNCRQCHLVDEEGYGEFGNHTLGNRTYADFARRSPIPHRDDGLTQTTRNAQSLVDALLPHEGPLFLHYDGQFSSVHDLIIGTLTGRNYGWKPDEYQTAVHHIASIIRNDDGMGFLATQARGGRFGMVNFGSALPGEVSYRNIFSGFVYDGTYLYDPRSLTPQLISPQYWLNLRDPSTTDEQILNTVASLIEDYLRNLVFSQSTNGVDFVGVGTPIFNGSPFDVFLIKNELPRFPDAGETPVQYSQRLLQLVNKLSKPAFVTDPADDEFFTQNQKFVFGSKELAGLKIFLRDKSVRNVRSGVGNCATCHALPAFTDFLFHNTGASQEEYDAIHGPGTFQQLRIPSLAVRQSDYDAYLPPTSNHPSATGRFDAPPSIARSGYADLGLWNIYANPDFPAPQPAFAEILPKLMGINSPRIDRAAINGRHFVLGGVSDQPGKTYYVLTATNPASASWEIIATNTFDAHGRFNFVTDVSPEVSQTLFKLSLRTPSVAEALPSMIARFKTPSLRDLGQSGPYLHTGRMDSLKQVVLFYQKFSNEARRNQVRNADPELLNIHLGAADIDPLVAFLRSLNEDYTD